jgi:hypothetical protein
MGKIRVRYRSGEIDEWQLNEGMNLPDLVKVLRSSNPTAAISFGVAADQPTTAYDFGQVGIRMSEIASWHVDGMLDDAGLIGPWSEAQEPA